MRNLKIIIFIISFMMLVSLACGTVPAVIPPTPYPVQPTYTVVPTNTPYPTAVPPTKVPPTDIPAPTAVSVPNTTGIVIEDNALYKGSGPLQLSCPDEVKPISQADKMICYIISDVGMGLVYLDNNDSLVAYAIAISVYSEDNAYDCGVFAAQVADAYGWSIDDVIGALGKIQATDIIYTSGTIAAKASMSDDNELMYVMFMPTGGFDS